MSPRGSYVIIPGAFFGLTLALWSAVRYAPAKFAVDLAQPLPVVTAWLGFGRILWILAAAAICVASLAYANALRLLWSGRSSPRLRFIVIVSAASLVAAMASPIVFSSDVYAYAAYGWMDAHSINPYSHTHLALSSPLIRAAVWQWGNPPPICVYGPLFVWLARIAVAITPGSVVLQLLTLRMVSSAALLMCGILAYHAFGRFPHSQRLTAAAGIALNPVAIWSAAEGHNDALMLVFVLSGFVLVKRFGYVAAAFVITASALIKASGIGAAAALILYSLPARQRFWRSVAGAACGLVLVLLLYRPFEAGMTTGLLPHGHYAPQFSAQYVVWQFLQTVGGNNENALKFAAAIVLVCAGALGILGIKRILNADHRGFAYLAIAFWLAIPNPYPWYALWILPAALLCFRAPIAWAITAASITIFARYLPDMSSASDPAFNVVVASCELALPVTLLAASWVLQRQQPVVNLDRLSNELE